MSDIGLILSLVTAGLTAVGVFAGLFWRLMILINRVDDKHSGGQVQLAAQITKEISDLRKEVNADIVDLHKKLDGTINASIRREEMQEHIKRLENGVEGVRRSLETLTHNLFKMKLQGVD